VVNLIIFCIFFLRLEENGSLVVRKLIEGIKGKKDTHDLLGLLYEIPASEKSYYAGDEAIGS